MTTTNFEKRLYGHRGDCVVFPENTLESFEEALRTGANCIESDVHQSRDGHFVLHHDATFERMGGVAKKLKDLSLSEIQNINVGENFRDENGDCPYKDRVFKAPTFEEALSRFKGVRFNVDVKVHDAKVAAQLVGFLKALDVEARVTLASFDARTLKVVRDAGFQGETAFGKNDLARLFFTPAFLYPRLFSQGSAVQVPRRASSIRFDKKKFIDKCHGLGLRVDFWTINNLDEGRHLLDLGADGLMSDSPKILAPLFDKV